MKTHQLMAALAIVAIVGLGAYQLGVDHGMQTPNVAASAEPEAIKVSNTAKARKILYWHDPMVPSQKFDKPGKSPFMDMQLVPVYAEEGDDASQVIINPRTQQNLGVRLAKVTHGRLTPDVNVVGNVAYNDRALVLVQARANGFIEKLYVRALLDPVKKGQALAELYVPDWVAVQEEFLTVKRMQNSVAAGLVDAARQRMYLAGMTEGIIKRVETMGKVISRVTIYSPSSGVISELTAREGMTVMVGAPLFRINGTRSVWVNAEIPETQMSQVRLGDPVEVRSPAYANTVLKGRVTAMLPQMQVTTRTAQARIELQNPHGRLVPGMFVNVKFVPTKSYEHQLIIPSEAIIQTGKRTVVVIAQGDGKFSAVDVEIGIEREGMTEITKGLHMGQQVVVSGQFLIDSEASLRATVTRMGDAETVQMDEVAKPVSYEAKGRVEAIGDNNITLSHEAIAALDWGAMTMGFKLPANGLPHGIRVGDRVVFCFERTSEGAYQIISIEALTDTKTKMEMKP